jgi:Domain of unknown function (DUF4352)
VKGRASTLRVGSGREAGVRRGRGLTRAGAVCLLLATASCLLAVAGCGGGIRVQQSKLPKIGDRVSNSSVAVVVHRVMFYDQVTTVLGSTLTPKSKNDVFAIVDLTVTNLKGTALRVGSEDVRLASTGSQAEQPARVMTYEFPGDFVELSSKGLAVGKSVRGMVAFSATKGTTLDRVRFGISSPLDVGLEGMKVALPPAKRPPGLGHKAKGGGLAIVVHSVSHPAQLTNGGWTTTARSGFKLCVVDITVQNRTVKPTYTCNELYVIVVDSKHELHWKGGSLVLGMPLSQQLPLKKLKPGQAARGKVVFSLPVKRTAVSVRYKVGVLGPPLEVQVR